MQLHSQKSNLIKSQVSFRISHFPSVLVRSFKQVSWISRPDISFSACKCRAKFKNLEFCDIIELNKLVKHIKNEKNQIVFLNLDQKSIKLITLACTSLNKSPNIGRQGGKIKFLADNSNKYCPLIWNCSKTRCVVRSTLTAKALALNEGSESATHI